MSRPLVLKFGGTSLAGAGRVARAARRIRSHVRRGRRVLAVVSAAGGTTDRILAHVRTIGVPDLQGDPRAAEAEEARAREVDRALATGEDRAAALLAVALWRLGVPARSLGGGEAGIEAEGAFGFGRVTAVDPGRVRALMGAGVVPVVSGFQATRSDGETVTLGRGGSDTSAVTLAAALGADCHIVTDVEAVFDHDPRLQPDARPFPFLAHHELVALVERGARVVHPEAARLAASASVPLRIYHFSTPPGAPAGTRVEAGAPIGRSPSSPGARPLAAPAGGGGA